MVLAFSLIYYVLKTFHNGFIFFTIQSMQDIQIIIFQTAENNNSGFAETICQNKDIFIGKYEIDTIKNYIDFILQRTLEIELNP